MKIIIRKGKNNSLFLQRDENALPTSGGITNTAGRGDTFSYFPNR
jgi:hypothetical protein